MPVRKAHFSFDMETPGGRTEEFLVPVEEALQQVRERIHEYLVTPYSDINMQLETIGAGRGKMLRPALLLLSGMACGSLRREHIELAAIIEMIHTATLLHDDVIDQAQTRRSQPAANCLWGNTAAVLLGDFLLSRAFLAGQELNLPTAMAVLGRTAGQICQGEMLQNIRRADWTMTQADYMEMIEAKTAALFSAACRLGAMTSGADDATAEKFAAYGRDLGLAFQITDDILDITGDDKKAGKTLGTDAAQKKPTLPLICYLSRQTSDQKKNILNIISMEPDKAKLVQILNDGDCLDYVGRVAKEFSVSAASWFSGQDAAVELLKKIALAVGDRV